MSFLCVSHFLLQLLFWTIFAKICIAKTLRNKDSVSLWGRGWICFLIRQPLEQRLNRFASTSPYMTGYFLSSASSDETQICWVCSIHLCIVPWLLGTRETNMNMKLMLHAVLWIIKSFVSDPVVLCLLLASMKPWQTNVLVSMEGKISDSSHFLTYPNFHSYRSYWNKTHQPALPNDEVSGFHYLSS